MGQKKKLSTDYLNRPLLELLITHHKQILLEFCLLHQQVGRVEAHVSSSRSTKDKEKEFYTTEDVTKMLSISKRTLLTFRNEGKIGFTKMNNTIRFTRENIESFISEQSQKRKEPRQKSQE